VVSACLSAIPSASTKMAGPGRPTPQPSSSGDALRGTRVSALAFGCVDFGRAAKTLELIWNQHRCSPLAGNTSGVPSRADRG
jgi:hypothetical protein